MKYTFPRLEQSISGCEINMMGEITREERDWKGSLRVTLILRLFINC